jgi:hypothetical protein
MSGKRFWLAGLVVVLGLGASRAQGQGYSSDDSATQPAALSESVGAPYVDLGAGEPTSGQGGSKLPPLSDWLLYPRSPGCCGPVGQHGPIQTDLFVRSGLIWPTGGGILVHSLKVGWDIEIGGRALFFDPPLQRAWTVSLSISNDFNPGRHDVPSFTLTNIPVKTSVGALQAAANAAAGNTNAAVNPQANTTPVTVAVPQVSASVASFNQTYVNVAFGREWYIIGCADCGDHWNWRVGADIGGRYGTSKLEFNEISHRTDVLGGIFLAAHTDFEYPCRCGTILAGMRTEWGYSWTDTLQRQNPGDFQSFALLFNLGVRF